MTPEQLRVAELVAAAHRQFLDVMGALCEPAPPAESTEIVQNFTAPPIPFGYLGGDMPPGVRMIRGDEIEVDAGGVGEPEAGAVALT